MSDHTVQSYNDEIPGKSLKTYESVWMAHWIHSSRSKPNVAPGHLGHDPGEHSDGNKHQHLLTVPEMGTDSSKCAKGFGGFNSKNLRSEMFEGLPSLSMFKPSQYGGSNLSLHDGESSGYRERVLKSRVGTNSGYDVSLGRTDVRLSSMHEEAPPEVEIQKRGSLFQTEIIKGESEEQVKSSDLAEGSLAVWMPSHDDFVRLTPDPVPDEFKSGRTPMQSFFSRLGHINEPCSTSLVIEKKMNSNADLIRHPPTTNNQPIDFFGKSFQKMPDHSDFELFPRQISTRDNSKLEKLCHGSYAPPRLPSVHDVETMRVLAKIDSIEEPSRGPPTISQTTRHFFIKTKTDINLSDGAQMFREPAISTEIKGKMVSELLTLSPDFGFLVKQGVKLQPLDSSTESEGKENAKNARIPAVVEENDSSAEGKANAENVKTSAVNEDTDSSAKTDTMDMEAFQENLVSGGASPQSIKDINEGHKSSASVAGMPSVAQETNGGQMKKCIPDINQELHEFPGGTRSPDDMETSTSTTQSLDMECLLPVAEPSTNSKSSDTSLRLDPCSRWIKRLKPTASDSFGYGTKISKIEEPLHHQKLNKVYKILTDSNNGSEPKISKSCGKEQMLIDPVAEELKNDSAKEVTLSHAWIQRWCHNPSSSINKKPKAFGATEPESSKATLDLQKKQFPSIAAMALMGKAMSGFRPCEFRKSGSSVFWNI